MRIALFVLCILLLSCSSKKIDTIGSDTELFVLDGFGEVYSAGYIDIFLYDKGIPKGILYRIKDEKLVNIETYTNGIVCQVVELDKNGKIESISTGINETGTTAQDICINKLKKIFYVADNCCREDFDSVKNGIIYHIDDSCRLTQLIKFEEGFVTNLTNLDGHGKLTDIVFKYNDVDTMFINPSDKREMNFTKEVMKVTFHPTGFYEKILIGYTTDEADIESAYIPPQEVEFRSKDGYPLYDSNYDFLKFILPDKLEKNATEMNDSQRSDYVICMLSVADSSFIKIDDFVVFLNYLQGKRTEEHSEAIGYKLMNIYMNNSDKIKRVEEYIAMMPIANQKKTYKDLCRILLHEYAINNISNHTIDIRKLYKSIPILKKHHTLIKEIAKESDIILVNK